MYFNTSPNAVKSMHAHRMHIDEDTYIIMFVIC